MKTNIINLTTVFMLGGLGSMYASNHAAAADAVGQRSQMPMATGMSPGQKTDSATPPAIPGPRRGRVASDSALGNSGTTTDRAPATDRAAVIPSPSLELAGSPNTPPISEKVYTVKQLADSIGIVRDREDQLIIALEKAEKQVKTLNKQVSQLQDQAKKTEHSLDCALFEADEYKAQWHTIINRFATYEAQQEGRAPPRLLEVEWPHQKRIDPRRPRTP